MKDLAALKNSHRLVAIWLRDELAKAGGSAALSQEQIAEGASVGRATVTRALKELKRRRLIVATSIKLGQAVVYTLPPPAELRPAA